jgi:6-pyruvoyltetrahydropterin/6-carboxytetrahydropterin synthase
MKRYFTVQVMAEFAAAHHIRGYEGDCARPHGHNYKVEVFARASELGPIGIAVDFKDLKRQLKALIDRYDHQDLNTIPPFDDINPTAETLARHFFEELAAALAQNVPTQQLVLERVTIWETDRCAVSYGAQYGSNP